MGRPFKYLAWVASMQEAVSYEVSSWLVNCVSPLPLPLSILLGPLRSRDRKLNNPSEAHPLNGQPTGACLFFWVGRRARGAREHVSRSLDDVIACLGPSPSGQSSRLVAMCEMIQVGRGGGIWRMRENDWLLAASVDLSSTPLKGKGKGKK